MSGPGDLFALAQEFLDACAAAVATSPGGAIARVFVAPGLPAFDCCPQLTVHVGGPAVAETAPGAPALAPGFRDDYSSAVNLVTLTATVIRCTPTVESHGDTIILPDPADLEASAVQVNGDIWAIWNHVRRLYRERAIFVDDRGEPREVFFDAAVSLVAAGGCAGFSQQVRVRLDGYGG